MKLLRLLSPSVLQKMKKVISVNYMIIIRHSVKNNTRMGLAVSLCPNSNHLISLIPPERPQILDIY